MGGTLIFRSPLHLQPEKTPEGFDRAIAIVPKQSKILYLGVAVESNEISLWALTPSRPRDAEDKIKPYEPHELGHIEFISALEGQDIPTDRYEFRATVPTAAGILFLFAKKDEKPKLFVPGGRG